MSELKPPTNFRDSAMSVFLPGGGVFVYDIRDQIWRYDRSDKSWTPITEADVPDEAKSVFSLGRQAHAAHTKDSG